jgi:ATP-binding cassette subfamily B protein
MIKKIYFRELSRVYSMIYKKKLQYFITILITGLAYPCIQIMFAFAYKNSVNAVEFHNYSLFIKACLLILISIIIQCIIEPIANCYNGCLVNRTIYHIRKTVFKHIEKLPIAYFENNHSGDTIARLTSDIEKFEPIYRGISRNLLQSIFYGVGAFASMLFINYKLALYSLFFSILAFFINAAFTNKFRRLGKQNQENVSKLTQSFINVYFGSSTAKIFNKEITFMSNFDNENSLLSKLSMKIAKTNVKKDTMNYTITSISRICALILGLVMVSNKSLDIGSVVGIVSLQAGVTNMFASVGGFFANLQGELAGVSRIFEILDIAVEDNQYKVNAVSKVSDDDIIAFENVCFSYDNTKNVLNNINFNMKNNKIYALVGPNGSGKSTLMKILLGFYEPKGNISFCGKALSEYRLSEIREKIAYVSQNSVLFNTSILENIRYGKLNATMEEVVSAAKSADIHDFIEGLEEGYETKVGENGVYLSGGQRQRIVIARALIKDAPIFIFDEATSWLDAENEVFILQSLKQVAKDRTIIIIAHRLYSIQNADWIYVMEKGQIKEQGKHTQLLDLNGLYRQLYDC